MTAEATTTGPRATADPVLRVEGLRTGFTTETGAVTAVDGVSFSVAPGQVLGVVGESGCGKSVTVESIMRLPDEKHTHYEGEVHFDGKNLLDLSEKEMQEYRGGKIGMIFQDPMSSLNPVYPVGDQIVEGILRHMGLDKKAAKARAIEMLRLTGIPSPEKRFKEYPHQLSGGMRQRVVIAMALACRPRLLIADEPTTALDVTTQAQILDLVEDLCREFDTGTIFITHDLGVVAEICDRVVVMYLGQVIEETNVQSLFDDPKHPYTLGLIRSTPDMEADRSQELHIIPGRVPTLANVPTGCRFADRCALATDHCRETAPELREIAPGHTVRCHRAEDIEELK
ncbi:ABC transporter ATP-binding protein [Brevibacterium litoralis]|uniref:ABC transporter ATP-binding protein n=1 Tax=Brevibacterium litoralis TaxID=3138935 RepID=UPI0032EB13DD